VQQTSKRSLVEAHLADWVATAPELESMQPAGFMDAEEVAAELGRMERNRARKTAREAELLLRFAELRPDDDDPQPGTPGARKAYRKTDPEFRGVSEFFPREVGHALNLGCGTAAFRARRAFTWRDKLPATFAALRRGEIDERRASKLAEVLQHTSPELAQAVEDQVLPGATDLAPGKLGTRALEVLAELDAAAIAQRHEEAEKAADARAHETGDGMSALTGDMSSEKAAACWSVIDQLAQMARADGDPRPIGQIRAEMMTTLILRPADNGLPGVTVHLAVTATLDGLDGTTEHGGTVNGFAVPAGQLRALLHQVGALGLQAPEGGSLTFALVDGEGRLLATVSPAELARLAAQGCPEHRAGAGALGCDCPLLGSAPDTGAYEPTDKQRVFVTTRDRTCRMPNCGQRAGWADLDHVIEHSCGGATSCTNLCCLCRSDHRLKTFARRWTFVMDTDGTLRVTSPSGITRTTRPPGRRPPPAPPPADPDDDPPF
jgi:hypothetical protein